MNNESSFDEATATALVKDRGRAPRLQGQERPQPRQGEVLLRVACVGLCRTDLLIASGRIQVARDNLVLGHEFSGVVEDADAGGPWKRGDFVAVDPTFERADGSDGFMGRETDGCLATWVCVPQSRLLRVPHDMMASEAAYLEPVAAAMGGVEAALSVARSGIPGLLIGENRIATLTASILASAGLDFEHVSAEALRRGLEEGSASCRYAWLLESRLEDDLLSLAAEALRARGTVILKSRHASVASFPAARWAEKQLCLAGRSRAGFEEAMQWLDVHRNAVRPLLGDAWRLADWKAAFEEAESGEGGKVFVVPPGGEDVFVRRGGRLQGA